MGCISREREGLSSYPNPSANPAGYGKRGTMSVTMRVVTSVLQPFLAPRGPDTERVHPCLTSPPSSHPPRHCARTKNAASASTESTSRGPRTDKDSAIWSCRVERRYRSAEDGSSSHYPLTAQVGTKSGYSAARPAAAPLRNKRAAYSGAILISPKAGRPTLMSASSIRTTSNATPYGTLCHPIYRDSLRSH